ncbi:hypothetical protein BV898_00036 [Hypsibius exemplaris]|uniref:Uncharacterized protein n=1 Tax=Hypsibius exemplaris TaxID=2072580 RepID=A0A1W0XEV1_HYPEX|nr:hypothetical protein BV898_00036 [Hypsibius exemplaris]
MDAQPETPMQPEYATLEIAPSRPVELVAESAFTSVSQPEPHLQPEFATVEVAPSVDLVTESTFRTITQQDETTVREDVVSTLTDTPEVAEYHVTRLEAQPEQASTRTTDEARVCNIRNGSIPASRAGF